MRSLLTRIFLAFWLMIAITTGIAVLVGYTYAERMREAFDSFESGDLMLEASSSLQTGGRRGLESWLKALPKDMHIVVYVIDERGVDLLKRKLPYSIANALQRFGGRGDRHRAPPPDPKNLRPARPLTRMIGPDDRVYTFFATPRRGRGEHLFSERTWLYFLLLAFVVSAAVSYLLARAITKPVRRLREATVAIASGNLDARVTESVGARRDEIGHLARDFDRMADELQESWQQKTELTRNVSHELRSPLARLRVALELARRQAGDLPEFARIDSEAERLDELVGQILDYAKLETRADDESASIQLDELLHQVVEDARYECRSSGFEGVAIELNVAGALQIDGYATALSSAIENVLRNAIRHSPPDGTISASLFRESAHAVIEIEDQGPGVPKSEFEQLFEPFFRSSSQTGHPDGSGLGLAIARRAVHKNHGTISAGNAVGGGLRVTIRIRLLAEQAAD